jgi:hypothetical protein
LFVWLIAQRCPSLPLGAAEVVALDDDAAIDKLAVDAVADTVAAR